MRKTEFEMHLSLLLIIYSLRYLSSVFVAISSTSQQPNKVRITNRYSFSVSK